MRALNVAAATIDYRAYLMDEKGHIEDVRIILASNDATAWRSVRDLGVNKSIELWCRDRVVREG